MARRARPAPGRCLAHGPPSSSRPRRLPGSWPIELVPLPATACPRVLVTASFSYPPRPRRRASRRQHPWASAPGRCLAHGPSSSSRARQLPARASSSPVNPHIRLVLAAGASRRQHPWANAPGRCLAHGSAGARPAPRNPRRWVIPIIRNMPSPRARGSSGLRTYAKSSLRAKGVTAGLDLHWDLRICNTQRGSQYPSVRAVCASGDSRGPQTPGALPRLSFPGNHRLIASG